MLHYAINTMSIHLPKSIILSACLFGTIYLGTTSLKELNKISLKDNNNIQPNKAYYYLNVTILTGSICWFSFISFKILNTTE